MAPRTSVRWQIKRGRNLLAHVIINSLLYDSSSNSGISNKNVRNFTVRLSRLQYFHGSKFALSLFLPIKLFLAILAELSLSSTTNTLFDDIFKGTFLIFLQRKYICIVRMPSNSKSQVPSPKKEIFNRYNCRFTNIYRNETTY